jgi:FixJ family two-component response regulator
VRKYLLRLPFEQNTHARHQSYLHAEPVERKRSTDRDCSKLAVASIPTMTRSLPFIAIVDDDDSVRRALTRVLTTSNFEVTSFASGEEFLASLRERLPDCAILDYQIQELTAHNLQQRIAAAQLKVPVIVVTAHDDPVLREQCMAAGAVGYLSKPLGRDSLLAAIDKALGRTT